MYQRIWSTCLNCCADLSSYIVRLSKLTFNRNDTNWTIAINLHAFWIPSIFWMHPLSSHGRRICRCRLSVPASYNWGTVHKRRTGKLLLDANCLKWHFLQNETNEESQWWTGILIKQIGSWRQGGKKAFSYQCIQLIALTRRWIKLASNRKATQKW